MVSSSDLHTGRPSCQTCIQDGLQVRPIHTGRSSCQTCLRIPGSARFFQNRIVSSYRRINFAAKREMLYGNIRWPMITWWMKLGGNLPPGDNPLLFWISGTGSYMPSRIDTALVITQSRSTGGGPKCQKLPEAERRFTYRDIFTYELLVPSAPYSGLSVVVQPNKLGRPSFVGS